MSECIYENEPMYLLHGVVVYGETRFNAYFCVCLKQCAESVSVLHCAPEDCGAPRAVVGSWNSEILKRYLHGLQDPLSVWLGFFRCCVTYVSFWIIAGWQG